MADVKKFSYTHAEPGITVNSLTGVTDANLAGFKRLEYLNNDDGSYFIIGWWTTGTFTQATYNAFPVGSIVYDFVGFTMNIKTGATTWKAVTLT